MRSNLKYAGLIASLVAIAVLAAYQYEFRTGARSSPATAQTQSSGQPAAPVLQQHTRLDPPLVGATYMGGNWPKNFINAFRREDVATDFAKLRADGFNAVVLLVSWGDFQPVFDPCCRYDERAFERLEFLIEQAREAGLDVVLRVGYGWTFQPDAGEVGARIHRLLNDDEAREAFFAYVSRLGDIVRRHANVRLSLLSWEDLILHTIDGDGRKDFRQFIDGLPTDDPLRASAASTPELPQRGGPRVALFNGYWDWLLMHKIFGPAAARMPNLTYEARIDSEPLPHIDADGKAVYEWIGHESTYRPPGADVVALYWAPFWGAQNQGERLGAEQSLHLFGALLDKVRHHSGALPMFIDQLNVIDNTLGFERNATLQAAALPAFMDGAFCAMRKAGVFGYAYWTTRDYAESPLYNPSFSYGLDGWNLTDTDDAPPASHLLRRASGDFDLHLLPGDRLSQAISARRGRLPGSVPGLPARICLTARTGQPAVVAASVGAGSVTLKFSGAESETVCSAIPTQVRDSGVDLEILGISGSSELTGVMLFDHVQKGGLYELDGKEGVLLPSLRKLNQRFAQRPKSGECPATEPARHAN